MSGIVKNNEALIEGVPAIVTTFTPTLDGHVGNENVNQSWSAKRSAAGNVSAYGGTAWAIRMAASNDASNPWRTFRPAMVLFDTSSIGSGTIISATFKVALNNKTDNFSDSMSLVNATPASNTALENADWADFGTTKQAADKTIASFSVDGSYNTMELNATGLAAINKTGITKYGFTFTSLVDNDENTWADSQTGVLSVQSALGTNPPQLVVTHTQTGGNPDTHTTTDTADVQIFTTTGSTRTWVKPSWANTVYIECIGGGAGGGSGESADPDARTNAGGGGGGGAMVRGVYDANSLPISLTVTVGATSAGGTISAGAGGNAGTTGNNSSVTGGNFSLTAYGGGKGGGGGTNGSNNNGGGGAGGGTGSKGTDIATGATGDGGNPNIQSSTQGDSLAGRGGRGRGESGIGGDAEYGGGGGGGGTNGAQTAFAGGASIFGAGGGGGGGGENPDLNPDWVAGAAGGAWSSYTSGSASNGGASEGSVGAVGITRSYGCGDGGGGGAGGDGQNAGNGGNGGTPGGGGGAGGGTDSGSAGAGGIGARGEVRIFSW